MAVRTVTMQWGLQITLVLTALLTSLQLTGASHVLFVLYPFRSHMAGMLKTAHELAKRGHKITIVSVEHELPFARKLVGGLTPPVENVSYIPYGVDQSYNDDILASTAHAPMQEGLKKAIEHFMWACEEIVGNQTLVDQLKALSPKPDLLVGDHAGVCHYTLAELIDMPHRVDYETGGSVTQTGYFFFGGNFPVSYFPTGAAGLPSTGRLTFLQRLRNLVDTGVFTAIVSYTANYGLLYQLQARHGVHTKVLSPQAAAKSVLCIVDFDWALQPAQPFAPAIKYVGSTAPQPAQPLPADLHEWIEGSGTAGTVLVSFGSTFDMPDAGMRTLAAAMARLPYRFILKLPKKLAAAPDAAAILGLSDNVFATSWLPQNDVLGHPGVVAFVTQGGHLSIAEAAYHGVPVVVVPIIQGQMTLAIYANDSGWALLLHRQHLLSGNETALIAAIDAVVQEPRFRARAQVMSRRVRAHPRRPVEQAADWVEYALEAKGEPFLLTADKFLPWWVAANLDVWALLVTAAALLIWGTTRCCCQGLRGRSRRSALDSTKKDD